MATDTTQLYSYFPWLKSFQHLPEIQGRKLLLVLLISLNNSSSSYFAPNNVSFGSNDLAISKYIATVHYKGVEMTVNSNNDLTGHTTDFIPVFAFDLFAFVLHLLSDQHHLNIPGNVPHL